MIGFLKGKVELLKRPFVIVDVNGVGYKVLVPETIYAKLSLGESLKIFTYTYVREDALDLFGFLEAEDLGLFESLLTVSGIGPKTALNIFSFLAKIALASWEEKMRLCCLNISSMVTRPGWPSRI